MQSIAQSPAPIHYATYYAPNGEELHGTAQETARGYLFLDSMGFTPFYASAAAVQLHGEVQIAEKQRTKDALAALWQKQMLSSNGNIRLATA